MPDSLFEVEHSTDIQNSLLKFLDLQDFNTRMFIVADASRKQSFQDKLGFEAFRPLRESDRVKFLSYDELEKLYNLTVARSSLATQL